MSLHANQEHAIPDAPIGKEVTPMEKLRKETGNQSQSNGDAVRGSGNQKAQAYSTRHGDSRNYDQPTWGDVLTFMALAVFVAAIACLLIIWRAGAF